MQIWIENASTDCKKRVNEIKKERRTICLNTTTLLSLTLRVHAHACVDVTRLPGDFCFESR